MQACVLSHFSCVQLFVTPWLSGEDSWECKKIKPVNPKGNQFWIFTGRKDAEAEAPILWPHDVKTWLNRRDPEAGKDWRQDEKGTTEDKMVGWHHGLNRHAFEQAPGDGEGQGSLASMQSIGSQRVEYDWTIQQQQKWFNSNTGNC